MTFNYALWYRRWLKKAHSMAHSSNGFGHVVLNHKKLVQFWYGLTMARSSNWLGHRFFKSRITDSSSVRATISKVIKGMWLDWLRRYSYKVGQWESESLHSHFYFLLLKVFYWFSVNFFPINGIILRGVLWVFVKNAMEPVWFSRENLRHGGLTVKKRLQRI